MTALSLTSKLDMESPEAKARAQHNRGFATDLRDHCEGFRKRAMIGLQMVGAMA